MTDLFLSGWRVRSEIPLPELAPWAGEDRAPDITIRLGSVVEQLADSVDVTPLLQLRRDGTARLNVEAVARYLLRDGREIIIDPKPAASGPEIRVFLLGTIFGLLCHWRGLFPLHASCVQIGSKAVAFSGVSGAGKSTMAATLAQRGHPLLSDDVCVIDPNAPGGPIVLPAFPRVKLWQDSLEAAGIAATELDRNRPTQNKFHFRFTEVESFVTEAVPLKAIYFLSETAQSQQERIEPLQGIESLSAIRGQIFRRQGGEAWGFDRRMLQAAGRIAERVSANRLVRGIDFLGLQQMAALIEANARP